MKYQTQIQREVNKANTLSIYMVGNPAYKALFDQIKMKSQRQPDYAGISIMEKMTDQDTEGHRWMNLGTDRQTDNSTEYM